MVWLYGGGASALGLKILEKSVCHFRKYYQDLWCGTICHVNCDGNEKKRIGNLSKKWNVHTQQLVKPNLFQETSKQEASRLLSHSRFGSLWKLSLPQSLFDAYTVYLDNDIVPTKRSRVFLDYIVRNQPFVALDNCLSVGQMYPHFSEHTPLNSGLWGLPKYVRFQENLRNYWEAVGQPNHLSSQDEQGLICGMLQQHDACVFSGVANLCSEGIMCDVNYQTILDPNKILRKIVASNRYKQCQFEDWEFLHFMGANRNRQHLQWRTFLAHSHSL